MFEFHTIAGLTARNVHRLWLVAGLVVGLLLCAGAGVAQAAPVSTASVQTNVEAFHAALMTSARSDADLSARLPGVAAAFDALFDVKRIARISAGRVWRNLDENARADYVKLLRDVVVSNYVSRFDADRGQSFATLSAKEVKPQRFVVRTQINRPNNQTVSLDYYFRDGRVFNVVADGVSDLSVRRADYAAIIKADGFDGLLAHLRAQLEAAKASDGA